MFTLQSIAAQPERPEWPERERRHGAAEASGFAPHAGLDIQPGERARLERLCRYVRRPRCRSTSPWAGRSGTVQRLKRVFAIEIDTCARCQRRLGVIARILAHRQRGCVAAEPELAPRAARAPPRQGGWL